MFEHRLKQKPETITLSRAFFILLKQNRHYDLFYSMFDFNFFLALFFQLSQKKQKRVQLK